jgi:hypothetical protein
MISISTVMAPLSEIEKSKSRAAANNGQNCADWSKLGEKSKDRESGNASVFLLDMATGELARR